MTPNYCPNCGHKLNDSAQTEDMPADYAPDLPEENQDPPANETIDRARQLVATIERNPDSPLVGQTGPIRSMLQELEDAIAKGDSLDLPYYRQTLFELAKELDRVRPLEMVSRMRQGG